MAQNTRSAPTRGSETQTATQLSPGDPDQLRSSLGAGAAAHETTRSDAEPQHPSTAILRLRGAAQPSDSGRSVRWDPDVVDNEGLGKKKSKVCCIYRPPREAGEEDSDHDPSSSSSSGSSDEDERTDPDGPRRRRRPRRRLSAGHDGARPARGHSPNAYERMPKVKAGGRKHPAGGDGGAGPSGGGTV